MSDPALSPTAETAPASVRHRSRLRLPDLLQQAVLGVVTRPARSALTALGVVLGVASFVAVVGLADTAGGQISQTFTKLTATEVVATDISHDDGVTDQPVAFGTETEQRAARIHGVRAAGVYWTVGLNHKPDVSSIAVVATGASQTPTPVVAASSGLFAATHATFSAGLPFTRTAQNLTSRVAVLGPAAASQLGIGDLSAEPAVFIDGVAFTVVGIVDDVARRPDILNAVIVPRTTATQLWGDDFASDPVLEVDTGLGAAPVVAKQLAVAVRPDRPDAMRVTPPPDPHSLRTSVQSDVNALFLALAGVCLVIGAVGIANTTMIAILERAGEIGLRRTLGARKSHIASQFLAESGLLGGVGGLMGSALGTAVVVIVALANSWTPLCPLWLIWLSPVAGAAIGVLAGLYPAIRASGIEPVEALKR